MLLRLANQDSVEGITVLADLPSETDRELFAFLGKPKKIAGINENGHLPSKSRSISSGKGSLKSSGTTNSPFASPKGRG
jgi:hypothetical protein